MSVGFFDFWSLCLVSFVGYLCQKCLSGIKQYETLQTEESSKTDINGEGFAPNVFELIFVLLFVLLFPPAIITILISLSTTIQNNV